MTTTIRTKEDIAILLASLASGCTPVVSCNGFIRSIRKMKEHSFCSLELAGNTEGKFLLENDMVQLVCAKSEDVATMRAMEHVRIGALVACTGLPACDRPGNLSIIVANVTILRASSEPDAIRRIICDQFLSSEEAGALLSCTAAEVESMRTVAAGSSGNKLLKQAVSKHSRVMVS